jgi:hypothetical protein
MGGGGGSVDVPDLMGMTGPAISAYHKAADVIEMKFPQALDRLGASLNEGTRAQLDSYLQANNISAPYVQTGEDSLNQLRYFMGMRPVDETQKLTNTLSTLVQQAKAPGLVGVKGLDNTLATLQTTVGKINDIKDPTQRAQEIAKVKTSISNMSRGLQYDRNLATAAMYVGGYNSAGGGGTVREASGNNLSAEEKALLGIDNFASTSGINKIGIDYGTRRDADVRRLLDQANKLKTEGDVSAGGNLLRNIQYGSVNNEQYNASAYAVDDFISSLNQLGSDVDKYIPAEYQAAPTGEEIYQKLREQPGYVTAEKQGEQALARSQAAKHMSLSGNAMIEAQSFGQNMATQAYQQQLANLGSLTGTSMPITQQSLGQQPQFGQAISQQFGQYGGAQYSNATDIARSRESAFIRQGDTLWDAAKMQAQMQFQANQMEAQSGGGGGFGQILGSVGKLAGMAFGGGFGF